MNKLRASAVDTLNSITQFNPDHKDAYEHCLILLERAGVRPDSDLRRAIERARRELGFVSVEQNAKVGRHHLQLVVSNY